MHYMLQFYENPEERAKHHDPAQVEAYFAGWTAFIGALAQSGARICLLVPWLRIVPWRICS